MRRDAIAALTAAGSGAAASSCTSQQQPLSCHSQRQLLTSMCGGRGAIQVRQQIAGRLASLPRAAPSHRSRASLPRIAGSLLLADWYGWLAQVQSSHPLNRGLNRGLTEG